MTFTRSDPTRSNSARMRTGEYAVWRATRQSSGYDIRTFEVRARPVEPVANLRPGMTVVIERK